ncbi:MAG: hypothetical protein JWN44_6182 [Myxococcales bacterium]|nr:hypothetical protein [Myxococcales bacterium]
MRILPALAVVAASSFVQVVHAAEPATAQAHVSVSDVGEYAATVSKSGEPTSLWVRAGGESVELRIQFHDSSRLHYEIKRSGDRQFNLTGAITPPYGKAYTIGHFPAGSSIVDIKLWLTDR